MKKNKKKLIIIALFVVTFGMGIGYSILSKQLKIEGTATIAHDYSVVISGIQKVDGDIYRQYNLDTNNNLKREIPTNAIENSEPTYTDSTASFDVTLRKQSSIIYAVNLVNNGDIDAILENVTINKTGAEAITVTSTQIDYRGAFNNGNIGMFYYLIVSFDETKEINDDELTSNISVVFDTKQKTTEVEEPNLNNGQFLVIGDDIIENDKIVGVNLKGLLAISVKGGEPVGDLFVSIDGGEYTSAGKFERKYIFPEMGEEPTKHIVKLKTNVSTEVTLELYY